MGKTLGSWSGMRKYLEQDMLAETLSGRVQYSCTKYKGMDGFGIFEVRVDGNTIKLFSAETMAKAELSGEKAKCNQQFWDGYWAQKNHVPLENRKEFDDEEFADALAEYRATPIDKSLESTNPIVRMFACLDRRIGKMTFQKLKDTLEQQPAWLQYFYLLRLTAEEIN